MPNDMIPPPEGLATRAARLDAENANLKALVARLTDNLENFVRESSDPGTEALAAIYCGRNLIYG